MEEKKSISPSLRKLRGHHFHELRIKVKNEIRIMLFSADRVNFNESIKMILYKKQLHWRSGYWKNIKIN